MQPIRLSFAKCPSSFIPYVKVVSSSKPLLAAAGIAVPHIEVEAREVSINARHLARYRQVCGIAPSEFLPHAYPHVLAMPLHMRVFVAKEFPVKVLGLVHLRNTIRQYAPIAASSRLKLSVGYQTLRETDIGQEYDLVTRCEVGGRVMWEEVSTMLARRLTPGKRPTIERAVRDEASVLAEKTMAVPIDTGRRYAWVSGDFNPIHLSGASARMFNFKQAVAHGMWSLACCVGQTETYLPAGPVQLDAQFKLPLYLPSEMVFRCQRANPGVNMSLTTPKGDRLHLAMQARAL